MKTDKITAITNYSHNFGLVFIDCLDYLGQLEHLKQLGVYLW